MMDPKADWRFNTHRFCIAPMLDWTDRHCRYLLRLIFPQARLYTEMLTTGALLQGDAQSLLAYNDCEHPLALQLGGSEPAAMAACARLASVAGYDEVNINVGCPSDRVQAGTFGACLMLQPQRVADCVVAMRAATDLPVTVKTRIGVDEVEEYACLSDFVGHVTQAGCSIFIIHARKAWLRGLSPKQNREIPPLRYDVVYRLKKDFPQLKIIINGGVKQIEDVRTHLREVDGVMIGRQAYQNPYALTQAYEAVYATPVVGRLEVVRSYLPYIHRQCKQGVPLQHMTRHMLGLFHGQPGAKQWRHYLTERARQRAADVAVIEQALQRLPVL